jgi:hypothetical protein
MEYRSTRHCLELHTNTFFCDNFIGSYRHYGVTGCVSCSCRPYKYTQAKYVLVVQVQPLLFDSVSLLVQAKLSSCLIVWMRREI